MKPITVQELYNSLEKLVKNGKGEYPVFITDDEECNGYHGCWYAAEAADDMNPEDAKYDTEINCDACVLDDPTKAVYIG